MILDLWILKNNEFIIVGGTASQSMLRNPVDRHELKRCDVKQVC